MRMLVFAALIGTLMAWNVGTSLGALSEQLCWYGGVQTYLSCLVDRSVHPGYVGGADADQDAPHSSAATKASAAPRRPAQGSSTMTASADPEHARRPSGMEASADQDLVQGSSVMDASADPDLAQGSSSMEALADSDLAQDVIPVDPDPAASSVAAAQSKPMCYYGRVQIFLTCHH